MSVELFSELLVLMAGVETFRAGTSGLGSIHSMDNECLVFVSNLGTNGRRREALPNGLPDILQRRGREEQVEEERLIKITKDEKEGCQREKEEKGNFVQGKCNVKEGR
jgi:hypothetical protein